MKKTILPIVRVLISIILIVLLLYIMRDKYGQIMDALKGASVAVFCLGVAVFILTICVASYRFKLLVEAQGETSITLWEAISLTFIGYFFNNFLPTSIGGDVVKAYYLSKKTSDKMGSFTSVFIDRAMGLVTMIFMGCIALVFFGNCLVDNKIKQIIYAVTAACAIGVTFMASESFAKKFSGFLVLVRPIEEKLKRIYAAINGYRHHKVIMTKSIIISVLSQLLFFASIAIMARSIGSSIPAVDMLVRMPIVCTVSLLPSINGLGLREGSMILLFGGLIGNSHAFVVGILWLITLLIVSVAGGLIYLFSPQFKIKFSEITS